METSQILLNNGIAFLAIATGIMLVVVGGFLIKLIVDLTSQQESSPFLGANNTPATTPPTTPIRIPKPNPTESFSLHI